MRAFILFTALILSDRVESVSICDSCECVQKIALNGMLFVNCSLHEFTFNSQTIMPNSSITLDASRSNLTAIPRNSLKSNTLEELLLNNNYIMEIDPYAFLLPELKRLDLSYNQLETLSSELFNRIIKLEYLNLANNKFSASSELYFGMLVNLKEIILDNNDIGFDIGVRPLFDYKGYGLTTNLKSLSISGIHLKNIKPGYFNPADSSLKKLIVADNNLTEIFIIPTNVEYFDISNNPIKKIMWEDFPFKFPLIYLRTLKLNNLDITEVPRFIFSALYLTTLEMENNKNLKEFSNLTFGRQLLTDDYDFNIVNLTLRGSNLSTLDKDLSVLFRRVQRLDLQDNPWVCDCNLAWVRELPIDQNLTTDLKCALPPYLHNRRIFDLDSSEFVCLKSWWERHHVGITVGLVLYIALVFVTLTWIYIYIYLPKAPVNKQEYSQMR